MRPNIRIDFALDPERFPLSASQIADRRSSGETDRPIRYFAPAGFLTSPLRLSTIERNLPTAVLLCDLGMSER
jgi:hypothetical protein